LDRLQRAFADASFKDAILRATFEVESEAGEYYRGYIRIIDSQGKVLVESPGMQDAFGGHEFPARPPLAVAVPTPVSVRHANGRSYLLLTSRLLRPEADQAYVVQLALDRSPEVNLLASYRNDAAAVLLIGLLVTAMAAGALARRALRPVAKLTQVVKGVRAADLRPSIPADDWPVELAQLAETFDEMLLRLNDSFERLSQFSADIAHELRTPLNILRGEAEVALSKARDAGEYRAVLESSMEEYDRLTRLVESLLFIARSDNAAIPLERKSLNAGDELSVLCEFFDAAATEQRVTLTSSGNAELFVDPMLFRRAVVNLVSNALRHTAPGGTVSLETEQLDGTTLVRVVDNGCGIPAQHIPRLFDRFYRVDLARKRGEQTGAGLGLAIVKSIMTLHGGSVRVESEPERGTAVTLSFPHSGAGG
jgi:two-component system heavy metal sensor histidine kinase CusS